MDDSPDAMGESRDLRSISVDLTDNSLVVDISDALSEKDKVKFTVHTKVRICCLICNYFQDNTFDLFSIF